MSTSTHHLHPICRELNCEEMPADLTTDGEEGDSSARRLRNAYQYQESCEDDTCVVC
jgi:hypothetical protein